MSARPADLTARAARPTSATAARLTVQDELFQRLDGEQIRYANWKSNEHLGATMTGTTDVDVLIDRRAAKRLANVLTETPQFKRIVVNARRGYPGIEDYVGFDAPTGVLTHLHLHYQLTLGEKFLKGLGGDAPHLDSGMDVDLVARQELVLPGADQVDPDATASRTPRSTSCAVKSRSCRGLRFPALRG